MAFCISGGGAVCSNGSTRQTLVPSIFSSSPSSSSSSFSYKKRNSQVVCAKKLSSRTGKFDSKNKRSGSGIATTPTKQVVEEEEELIEENQIVVDDGTDDELSIPVLPGEETDFWEGPQWETFGFVIQYLWAFGLVFALIGCGIAVATYNEGATDFKQTPVYKESMESRELLEEPESSNSDVFEANPTEEAPSLE